jgi:cell division protein FtsW
MDARLLTAQVLLGAFGTLAVATGRPELALEQGVRVILGLLISTFVARLTANTIVRVSPYAYLVTLLLLLAVIFWGSSPTGSESRRWLIIGGLGFQPSEFMKVVIIAYLAAFFYNHLGNWQIWRPMVVVGFAAGLIVAQPDVSTAAFLFALSFAIMLAAGTSLARLLAISTSAGLIALLLAGSYLSQFEYIGDRFSGYVDFVTTQEKSENLSFQAIMARRTLQRAGFFGIGPGHLNRVPESWTDMVAINIAQALGLTGIATLIVLYVLFALRGLYIASRLRGPGSLLAAGATTYICGQAGLNLLVSAGLIPVTGIPLPFVSYGLNSMISAAIAAGFIHSGYRAMKHRVGK